MRLTERHCGVAVIKDKSLLSEAMEKLARMEEIEEDNCEMDNTTTEMMEHICDNLCRHPKECENQDALEEICADCKMGKFVCDILNMYNRICDFDNSNSHRLMVKIAELEKYKETVEAGCTGCIKEEWSKDLYPCRCCIRAKREDLYERKEG